MNVDFNIAAYQYDLPAKQIAQLPVEKRDRSRLLVLDCRQDTVQDLNFADVLHYLQPGDLLVVNDTKVFPARLEGNRDTGGKVELFLLEYPDFSKTGPAEKPVGQEHPENFQYVTVTGLLRSSKRPGIGSHLFFNQGLEAEVLQFFEDGKVLIRLRFDLSNDESPEDMLLRCGRVPLPPYIRREQMDHPVDRQRYQTLFANRSGAVAAPTAGLHFSESLIRRLQEQDIRIAPITLHVGYGTFAPVRAADIRDHNIHEEYVEVSARTAELINQTRRSGKKVWAVGTTTVRSLEFAADAKGLVAAKHGWCKLYIYPGYKFKVVDTIITNFHLPGSSLLFLVAALAGRSRVLKAYHQAIQLGYRFYSYGDAMLIIT